MKIKYHRKQKEGNKNFRMKRKNKSQPVGLFTLVENEKRSERVRERNTFECDLKKRKTESGDQRKHELRAFITRRRRRKNINKKKTETVF